MPFDFADATGARACFRTVSAWGVDSVRTQLSELSEPGFYVVVATFEGQLTAVRMREVHWHESEPWAFGHRLSAARGEPSGEHWASSLDQRGYEGAVSNVRERIAAGDFYQVNVCRVLSREWRTGQESLDALFAGILAHNPAPYACRIDLTDAGLDIASASPELFLSREGARIVSAPIKGTAPTPERMLAKDATENIMITDLVRNDLQRVSEPGTVAVEGLLTVEQHPGLVHLVSTVTGKLRADVSWQGIFDATFPPGSVSGAPKSSALRAIDELEPADRGPYCGAIGWIDTESGRAELAVGIRTFWVSEEDASADVPADSVFGHSYRLRFGTGAGITWDSDPHGEWQETELKARKLLRVADGEA